ncbi:hypothetical protein GJA_854 [Janthinobacterium agaricidamnosum NBRC 102515 = DSM 9628]|uniref:Uncharacterized protein n=1 Tax=Janthinobacterium agaricidamnosum NBRC 102515 = DSM 9628 TaxID=1349767 RepID=W0V0X3_9BURK|nr:hypothetical protein GJA_854 [Janthinobacterium agaricidamnosum NBRC 102515 = DSM 9628]
MRAAHSGNRACGDGYSAEEGDMPAGRRAGRPVKHPRGFESS